MFATIANWSTFGPIHPNKSPRPLLESGKGSIAISSFWLGTFPTDIFELLAKHQVLWKVKVLPLV